MTLQIYFAAVIRPFSCGHINARDARSNTKWNKSIQRITDVTSINHEFNGHSKFHPSFAEMRYASFDEI